MEPTRDPDAIIHRILARFPDEKPRVDYRRATLVLEPGLGPLAPALADANFVVVTADNLDTFERRRALLSGRVLITRNTGSFIDDAPVLDAGIIGLDALPDIDIGPTLPDSATAVTISRAFLEFELAFERGAFLVLLHPEYRHVFRRLS